MTDSKLVRILTVYSVVSAAAIIWLAFLALSPRAELSAERVNIVDPAGKLRLTLSNSQRLPMAVVNGREIGGKRDVSGLIFYNDEGTECGGLIYGGKGADGKVQAGAHLSFDQFNQDQALALQHIESGGTRYAGLVINDQPEIGGDKIEDRIVAAKALPEAERQAAFKRLADEGLVGARRLFVGKNRAKESQLVLHDAKGRPRLTLRVAADGAAEIVFTDAAGKVTKTVRGS